MNPAEDYILKQNEPYRSILLHICSIIERVVPNVQMKYKWNIPCFYTEKQPICYLNVVTKKKYVDVGLWSAAHLTKHTNHMVTEGRKVIKSVRYKSLEEIDDLVLSEILQESYELRSRGFYKKS